MEALLVELRGPPRAAASPRRSRGLALAGLVGAVGVVAALIWGLGREGATSTAATASAAVPASEEAAGDASDDASATTGAAAAMGGASTGASTTTADEALATTAGTGTGTGTTGGDASEAGEAGEAGEAVAPAVKSPRKRDWCYMDEDRYLLLRRMPKRRSHIRDRDGRCYACRIESRAARVQRFQPDDCAHYQVCGRVDDGECG
jgi:hypothetical protein